MLPLFLEHDVVVRYGAKILDICHKDFGIGRIVILSLAYEHSIVVSTVEDKVQRRDRVFLLWIDRLTPYHDIGNSIACGFEASSV